MRIGEALSLTLPDVDLRERLVTVRNTKFFKARLAPIGPRLTRALSDYRSRRWQLPLPAGGTSAFFAARTGLYLDYRRVNKPSAASVRRQRSLASPPCAISPGFKMLAAQGSLAPLST
jgi:integrase